MAELLSEEIERYDRQIRMEGFGREGQLKLKRAKVMVAGLGGLGCPASLYLAAAGVGKLILVDREKVEISNLNRQTLHWTGDIGKFKVQSAVEKLRALNPLVEVEVFKTEITVENVRKLVREVNVVVDGMDNWRTRFILNEACVKENVPFIHAGVHSTYGQLMTVLPGRGPCLRCILPKNPPELKVFPIIGVTAGVFGALEALEAIKLIVGFSDVAVGKIIYLDLSDYTLHKVSVRRRVNCPVCSSL